MSGGFFRGTSAEQDTRFSNKQAKLLKTQKFAAELEHLVDMTKVKMDVIKPWIAKRVTEFLDGFEDEVLINLIYGLLEGKEVNGKLIQIQLTGFLEKNTGKFMKELWALLLSAQKNASGVPQQFLDAKEEETRKKKEETDRIFTEIQRRKEKENKESEQDKEKQMDDGIDNNHTVASNRRRERGSGVQSGDENGADVKNGFRGRTRASKSPSDHSQSPHRIARSRSISKSYSNSRSYSKERSLSRSVSVSPGGKGRSVSPGGGLRPPRRSITPRRQSVRESKSPTRTSFSRRRSSSRTRYRSPSPMRRRVRSPVRRSPSPFRRRSPHVRRSPSPSRRWSRSPLRRRSPPRRRRSPSPWRRRSPSPGRPRSPFVRRRRRSTSSSRSRSPAQRRSPSPFRHRFQSPARRPSFVSRRRSPVPARLRSTSPVRRRSPPPVQRRSPSPSRIRSPSPSRRRSPSPSRRRSPPPFRRRSPPPSRRRSPSPSRSRRRSPSPALRKSSLSRGRRSPSPVDHRSLSPVRDRSPVAGRRRSPYISPSRSPSSASQSSRSPVRRTASPVNKMRSPRLQKSPRGSPRVKNRDDEPAMMARKQPISLSPQRDHSNRKDSRRKAPSVSPSPEKLPYVVSPHVQTRSSGEDRRLASPRSRLGEKMALNGGRSPSRLRDMRDQRNRHGSPKITEDMIENDREYLDKKKLDERKSGNLSVGKQRESPNQPMRNRHRNSVDATQADNEITSEVASLKEVHASKRSPCRGSLSSEKLGNVSKLDEQRKPQLKNVRDTTVSDTLVISQKKRRSPTVDSDSGSEESQKHRTEVSEKRKHRKSRRKEVESDDTSSESEIEDRKEAKRRKKEERKLRKEERRRRREERRRKREEKRASKRKRKSKDADALSSDLENNGKHSNVSNGERLQKKYSSEEDTELQKKRLEIELREKALESLRAKKGIDR